MPTYTTNPEPLMMVKHHPAVYAAFFLMFLPCGARAQGANVDVTVLPQGVAGQPVPSRAGFLVCVGTASDLDQYGTETTTTTGVANQNFRNLPVGAAVRVTVTKSGYTGVQLSTTLRDGWNNHLQASMYAGSGGPVCASATTSPTAPSPVPPAPVPPPAPRTPVVLSGSVSTIIAPDPPPRLGPEALAVYGDIGWHENSVPHSCRAYGPNYMLTGIRVRHRVTSLVGLDLYCAPLRADGTLGLRIFRPADAPAQGTVQDRICPAGQAVVGLRGTTETLEKTRVRSLTLYCAAIGSSGLSSGAQTQLTALGIASGQAFGPSMCTQRRPASGVASAPGGIGEVFVASIQLLCEQPQRP